jgi:hypothetical protein
VELAFEDEPVIQERECSICGGHYVVVKSFVVKGGTAHAIAFAALHNHHRVNETWIDAIFGTFTEDAEDHISFGCRIGVFAGKSEQAASLLDAAIAYNDSALWGRKLTSDEARHHPRINEYWALVDVLLTEIAPIHAHVYGVET